MEQQDSENLSLENNEEQHQQKQNPLSHPKVKLIGNILRAIAVLWELWVVVTAFIGGPLPFPFQFIHVDGGLWTGLLFLFIIIPLFFIALNFTVLLVSIVIGVLIAVATDLGSETAKPE